jgi:hypothetical protein
MYHTQTQRIFQSFFNIFNQFLLYDDSERLVIIVIFEEISLFIFARVRKSMLNYGSARRSLGLRARGCHDGNRDSGFQNEPRCVGAVRFGKPLRAEQYLCVLLTCKLFGFSVGVKRGADRI